MRYISSLNYSYNHLAGWAFCFLLSNYALRTHLNGLPEKGIKPGFTLKSGFFVRGADGVRMRFSCY